MRIHELFNLHAHTGVVYVPVHLLYISELVDKLYAWTGAGGKAAACCECRGEGGEEAQALWTEHCGAAEGV